MNEVVITMDRELLNRYKKNKRELVLIDKALLRLQERLENVPVISGKVTKSSDDFPYIEKYLTVEMAEPKAAAVIKDKIREKEARRRVITTEMMEVEDFIRHIPDGEDREIFEAMFIDDVKQWEIADMLNMERSNISKRINRHLKLSRISQS